MFRHPKYYKELRKRNKSDQIISPRVATASARRAAGPGQQLGEVQPCDREATPSSKPQASSSKLSQNLVQVLKHQATSCKAASTGVKRQAASYKLSDPCTTVQEY